MLYNYLINCWKLWLESLICSLSSFRLLENSHLSISYFTWLEIQQNVPNSCSLPNYFRPFRMTSELWGHWDLEEDSV
jgi:hypothetical protein